MLSSGTYFDPSGQGPVNWVQGTQGTFAMISGGYTICPRPAKIGWAAGATPQCSVSDNLYVMAVLEASYLSSQEGRAVHLQEIIGGRYQDGYGPGWHRDCREDLP